MMEAGVASIASAEIGTCAVGAADQIQAVRPAHISAARGAPRRPAEHQLWDSGLRSWPGESPQSSASRFQREGVRLCGLAGQQCLAGALTCFLAASAQRMLEFRAGCTEGECQALHVGELGASVGQGLRFVKGNFEEAAARQYTKRR